MLSVALVAQAGCRREEALDAARAQTPSSVAVRTALVTGQDETGDASGHRQLRRGRGLRRRARSVRPRRRDTRGRRPVRASRARCSSGCGASMPGCGSTKPRPRRRARRSERQAGGVAEHAGADDGPALRAAAGDRRRVAEVADQAQDAGRDVEAERERPRAPRSPRRRRSWRWPKRRSRTSSSPRRSPGSSARGTSRWANTSSRRRRCVKLLKIDPLRLQLVVPGVAGRPRVPRPARDRDGRRVSRPRVHGRDHRRQPGHRRSSRARSSSRRASPTRTRC